MASQSISFKPASAIKQLPWSLDRKAALGLLLILGTFSLVGWLYLGQASMITSSTMKIDALNQEINFLNQQNSELALEIAQLESMSRVEEQARTLGLAPTSPENIRYMRLGNFPVTPEADPNLSLTQSQPAQPAFWQTWLDTIVDSIAGTSK